MYGHLYDFDTVVIRPFNIFSDRQDPESPYSGVISKFVERARRGLPPIIYGDGEQTRDFVSVYDVIRLVEIVLERGDVSGIYNCGTGKATSINELARVVMDIFGVEGEPVYMEIQER